MPRAIRGPVTVVAWLAAAAAIAQTPPAVVTTLPHPDELPPPLPAPPPVGPPPLYDAPCPPPPELVTVRPPAWFAAADLGFLFPHVTQATLGTVTVAPLGAANTVRLPSAGLESTVAPTLSVGYRFRDDLGALVLTYHNLTSVGREGLPGYDPFGDGVLRSRLDLNTVTLAYATREQPLGALWGLRWEVGAKLGTIFFDSQAQGPALGERFSNHFVGAGPMAALSVTRELPPSGLALFGRVEGADLLGRVTQRFATTVSDPLPPGGLLGFGESERHGPQGVPMLGVQAGVSWLSPPDGRYRLTAGYQYEQFWAVGQVGPSRGDVLAQGLFLRAEINY